MLFLSFWPTLNRISWSTFSSMSCEMRFKFDQKSLKITVFEFLNTLLETFLSQMVHVIINRQGNIGKISEEGDKRDESNGKYTQRSKGYTTDQMS
jgi:hypothetical protein